MKEKYNLSEELELADHLYTGDPSIEGKCILTFPQYSNSMRSIMFASHLNQFKNQIKPDFPGFFTGAENLVGKYSSGYKRSDNAVVYRKIVKFDGLVDNPTVYKLFVYNKKKKRYEVFDRKECEDLIEVFGFRYNNEVIDSLEEGDEIEQDSILYSSTSYDKFGNYAYGRDVPTMFSLDPFTSEDAAVISDELQKETQFVETNTATIMLNNNDFPLNLYGDEYEYKSFPNIGENSNGILIGVRKKDNKQQLYDFKSDMLQKVITEDTKYYLSGRVVDIDIFMNNEEFKDNSLYHQIYEYWVYQNQYYREIKQTCESIFRSGEKYSSDIDYLYKRACEMLDLKKRWKEKDTAFSNVEIHIQVEKVAGLEDGQKVSGRSGNKSVIAKVRPVAEMPYYIDSNGEKHHVHLIYNLLAFVNRTIAAPLFEHFTNFIGRRVGEYMRSLKTREEKENIMFDVLRIFNAEQCEHLERQYSRCSEKEKDDWISYCENVKIHFHQPSMTESEPIFYRLSKIYDKYANILQPDDIYIHKFGRDIKCIMPGYISNMYVILLKQTAKKGFSVRGIGAINSKGIPERNYKSKSFKDLHSSTAVRFGESENLTFAIGMLPEEVALVHAYYRTSIKARKDIGRAILKNESVIDIDKTYDSRVAQFFDILLMHLGFEMKFIDSDSEIVELDKNTVREYVLDNGKTLLCTEYDKFMIDRRNEIAREILEEYGILNRDILNDMIDEEIEERKYIIGGWDGNMDFMRNCIEIDPKFYAKTTEAEITHDIDLMDVEVDLDD